MLLYKGGDIVSAQLSADRGFALNAGDGVDLYFAKLGGATADKVSGQKSNELLIPL